MTMVHFVGQGDILTDKGTFLSDKGTFLNFYSVDQAKPAIGNQGKFRCTNGPMSPFRSQRSAMQSFIKIGSADLEI